ncbi:hypothetical protein C465_01704 [Halorubrum distributum JCM 9100]|uniref:Uncharacterized protein n=2 Tax=Halorubrum distributum TaxID=29283 RepID=M0EZI8_9EURY|nr:hypothetical protein C465_01704 [Halorubrum distributum JCM 9100]ELZ58485.1 hypothetical protein C466_00692 [Halorubrum distributum JCM 10118]
MDTLSSDSESICDISDVTWSIEIPTHAECGWGEQFRPVYVAELHLQRSIRFGNWMFRDADTTLIAGPTGFCEQSRCEQFVEYVVQMVS